MFYTYIYMLVCEFPKLRKTDVVGSVSCVKYYISQAIVITNTVCEHLHTYRHL